MVGFDVIRAWLVPESALPPEDRATFAAERAQYNRRLVRVLAPIAFTAHAAVAYALLRVPAATPAEVTFARYALAIDVTWMFVAVGLGVAAWTKESGRVHLFLGDMAVVAYVAMGSLVSANAQRMVSTLQMFLLCTLMSALLRPRPWVQAASIVLGLAFVLVAVAVLQQDAHSRSFALPTALAFCAMAIGALGVFERVRVRELQTRSALARLNADLERRVDEQVREIVARAKEVDQLNVQLAEKVQERSRELSVALARLASEDGASAAIARGTVLGDRVVVEAPIAEGGMGIVYRGYDRVAKADVAVKLVQAASAQELDGLHRFLREAQAMAKVHHPGVVRSLHVDVSEDGRLFQVMELVDGETLHEQLKKMGAMPPKVASRIGAVLADALAAAHAAGVIHCDVKPSNVMLTAAVPGLKLLDFGVSKLRDARVGATAAVGHVLGTPEFMAPEQFDGRAEVTDRTDVYALGLVVYECLARRLPYRASTPREWLLAHTAREPAPVKDLVPELDAALADVVMDCLTKDARQRPSAAEVARALSAHADAAGAPALDRVKWSEMPPPASRSPLELAPTVASRR
jgi:serine/threonine-protein kinase